MKNFTTDLISFPKLKRVTIDGVRHYVREEGDIQTPYPSVTTVLAKRSKEAIKQWRKRVGEKKANAITTKAARRGTKAHKLIEQYILGEQVEESMPNEYELFKNLQKVADEHIDSLRSVEGQMMSDYLRVAGTVDLVAEWNGRLAVIDWKTSLKPKKKEWAEGYFMQEAAYAVMFEENTQLPVDTLVTIIACETGDVQIFEEKRDDWINKFIEFRDDYEESRR